MLGVEPPRAAADPGRGTDAPVRFGALPGLTGAMAIGMLALASDSLPGLLGLLVLVLAGYAGLRLSPAELWRDVRWLLAQSLLIVGLTVALRGPESFQPACRTALQIVLVFLPVALVVRSIGTEAVLDDFRRFLPERLAFALGATLRFLPFFARETRELIEMQRLRGARLGIPEIWQPRAWRDWLSCVAVPMTIRAIEIAEEAADAATLRGIGRIDPASGEDPT